MKSSKNNNNEILDLHSSLKTIAKMSGDEILSKIGEAKIVKKSMMNLLICTQD